MVDYSHKFIFLKRLVLLSTTFFFLLTASVYARDNISILRNPDPENSGAQENSRTLPDYSPRPGQDQKDPPTLIIAIPGIGSYKPGASGERVLNQAREMMGTRAKGYETLTVFFQDDTLHTGSPLPGAGRMRQEAKQLAEVAKKYPYRVIKFQTEISGIPDIARQLIPVMTGGRIYLDTKKLTISTFNQRIRTRWEDQNNRAAIAIRETALEFRERYGENARVVLVGHSDGTEIIDKIPTTCKIDGKEKRLVDWRILSSVRKPELRYQDHTRTIFVEHNRDLPFSPGARIDLTSKDVLKRQGFVIEMKGGFDSTLNPLEAHNKTFDYSSDVNMEVSTFSGSIEFKGKAGNVIRDIMNLNQKDGGRGDRVPDRLLKKLEEEKPKQSRVGGVSMTKPAEVPIDPGDIRELQYHMPSAGIVAGMPYEGLSFLMKSGEEIYLPQITPGIEAAAFICVDRGLLPEINIFSITDAGGTLWKGVDYRKAQPILPQTSLGDMLLKADRIVGDLAFGNTASYRNPRSIKNYHPYIELAMDNRLFTGGKRGIRAWLVPSGINTELIANRLEFKKINMTYLFEAFDLADAAEYFAGRGHGYSDPAGEFLSAQLTGNYEDLQFDFPELTVLLKKTAGLTGILLWAYENNVHVSEAARNTALRVFLQDKQQTEPGSKSLLQIREFNGQDYYVHRDPAGPERKPGLRDIKLPAPVFNEFGLSRLLWNDGSVSRIKYDTSGRIIKLIGRRDKNNKDTGLTKEDNSGVADKYKEDDDTDILYDDRGYPMAMIDGSNNGVAVIWADKIPILCSYVKIDKGSREIVFNSHSEFEAVDNVEENFTHLLTLWIEKQTAGKPTGAWQNFLLIFLKINGKIRHIKK